MRSRWQFLDSRCLTKLPIVYAEPLIAIDSSVYIQYIKILLYTFVAELVPQVQNFLSGAGRLTVSSTTVTTLNPTSENITTMTELLLIPGM